MKVIQEPNQYVLETYKEQYGSKIAGQLGKISAFVLTVPVDEGMLLYNTITKELVLFEGGDDMFSNYFYEHLFVFDPEVNELDLAYDLKCRIYTYRPREFNVNGYTIVTTTECNARCFYCYEKGHKQIPMSDKVAEDVAKFIMKTTSEGPISISWFGGEPLYNQKPMDIISTRLKEKGREYSSIITTNGYYFDEDAIKKAKELWNVKNVQITIDGLAENYNKAKNYDNNDSDPFETVISNIEHLIANGIFVMIRINIGDYNIEESFELVDFLTGRLGDSLGKYSIYAHPLFSHYTNDINTEEKEQRVFAKLIELEDKLHNLGFMAPGDIFTNDIYTYHCMADNKTNYVIQANGNIGLCEHFVDSEAIGSIYKEELDTEKVKEFEKLANFEEKCLQCPLYPQCSRLEKCHDVDAVCTPVKQSYKLNSLYRQIRDAYAQKSFMGNSEIPEELRQHIDSRQECVSEIQYGWKKK